MMRALFVQPNFPGQYVHLLRALAAEGAHDLVFLADAGIATNPPTIRGVELRYYGPPECSGSPHPNVRDLDNSVRRGEQVFLAARALRECGFVPDVICAHHGYGEPLFLKQVFPEARLLGFFEYYYGTMDADLGFDPEFPPTPAQHRLAQIKNSTNLLTLEQADHGITPTRWQWSRFPSAYRDRLTVLHDGIDTDSIRPEPRAALVLPDGSRITRQDELVSFVVRGLEPLRGFHSFLRSLPRLLTRRSNAQIVIVGRDRACYGPQAEGETWRTRFQRELGNAVPWDRVHFVGWLDRAQLTRLFQVARAHVYLTYPFVLSWSVLEAMAAAVPVVGSDTTPVREVIRDGDTGRLVDFFDPTAIADRTADLLAHPEAAAKLGTRARAHVRTHYDLSRVCLPGHRRLLDRLAGAAATTDRPNEQFDTIALDGER